MSFEILKKHLQKERPPQKIKIAENKPVQVQVPLGLYEDCPFCQRKLNKETLEKNFFVCHHCEKPLRLRSIDRINMTVDAGSFIERGKGYITLNPFFDKTYDDKIIENKNKTQLEDAFIYGSARIDAELCVIGVLDSHFMMGSMGSVVGEKVTKAIEYAYLKKYPLIIFVASGGARMQEGIFSLMQMAKTSSALYLLDQAGLLFVSVLTDPTMGGVTASFAMLGDIILAEPKALIGFAGPRVIEQTIKETLPEGFQTSEFLLKKGFVDKIVPRPEMKTVLGRILHYHA